MTAAAGPKPDAARLVADLRRDAARLGFATLGVTRPDAIPEAPARLARAVADGHHAGMEWLAETAGRRADPRVLWPEVRSIVMLGFDYGPAEDPLAVLAEPEAGGISVYARHRDYHEVIKGRLKELSDRLRARARAMGLKAEARVFVDTAPVMEKPLAAAAGLGWQGKHTNLVSRRHGSWLFLGAIFTTLDLPPDAPEADHCGSCRRCLDACPTDAFPAPYRLDARRCISYLTIEHAGPIPRAFRAAMGNRIYGCDDCLAVCPWNKYAQVGREAKLAARADLRRPSLVMLAGLDDRAFRAFFAGSPIKRIGRDRFVRNVAVALGNAGAGGGASHSVRAAALRLLDDASPLVRGAAVWAVGRLMDRATVEALAEARAGAESDPEVRAEWEELFG